MSQFPLVMVEWEDAVRPDGEWEFIRAYKPPGVCQCQSVGWLVSEGNGQIILAPNMAELTDGSAEQMSGMIRIPLRAVTSRVTLMPQLSEQEAVCLDKLSKMSPDQRRAFLAMRDTPADEQPAS